MKNYFKKLLVMFLFILAIGSGKEAFASTVAWNPNDSIGNIQLSNGNLTTKIGATAGNIDIRSNTYRSSGKWYCELKVNSMVGGSLIVGVANENFDIKNESYTSNNQLGYYSYDADIYPSITPYGSSYGANDVIGIAIDIDNKKIKFSKNGQWYNDINLPTWSRYYVYLGSGSSGNNSVCTMNFGDSPFVYNPPTGYLAYSGSWIISNISLNKSADSLQVGQTDTLVSTIIPDNATNKNLTWSSSDSSIVTVDSTGNIAAIKEGQAVMTATTTDGSNLRATCTVTVTNPITPGITLNKTSDSLTMGQTDNLAATTTPAGAQVTWASSDSSIATVDSTGKVTAIKAGSVIITASTSGGVTTTCTVTVANITGGNTTPTNPTDNNGGTSTGTDGTSTIVNIAHAKGDNTNNAGGDVSIIFNGLPDTTLSVVKTADVKSVYVGDTFTYTIVVTNTGTKTAKSVVINDSAPAHIQFMPGGITTTQGTVDPSSTSSNILVNVGDIPPLGTVTIKIPATVIL